MFISQKWKKSGPNLLEIQMQHPKISDLEYLMTWYEEKLKNYFFTKVPTIKHISHFVKICEILDKSGVQFVKTLFVGNLILRPTD